MIVTEKLEDVDGLMRHLNGVVISLRKHPYFKELSSEIKSFYKKTISPWNESVLDGQYSLEEETIVKNKILDFINELNETLKDLE